MSEAKFERLYVNKSPQKICCSSFNALSIMEVIIPIEKGVYPKHHLVQLHRKPITTTKAFSFLYKRTIRHFHLFSYRASLFAHKPTMPSGLFMDLSSTIIYTSELILCSTICVPSATRHNIHMYPYWSDTESKQSTIQANRSAVFHCI